MDSLTLQPQRQCSEAGSLAAPGILLLKASLTDTPLCVIRHYGGSFAMGGSSTGAGVTSRKGRGLSLPQHITHVDCQGTLFALCQRLPHVRNVTGLKHPEATRCDDILHIPSSAK